MLVPIAMIEETRKSRKYYNYLMYNKKTGERVKMTPTEIKENIKHVRGFTLNATGLRLRGAYKNLGCIGKEPDDPNIKYYTAIWKIVETDVTYIVLIKREGDTFKLEKSKLIELISKGHQVAGARVDRNGQLKLPDVEEVINGYPRYGRNKG